jgi:hypothetical protein
MSEAIEMPKGCLLLALGLMLGLTACDRTQDREQEGSVLSQNHDDERDDSNKDDRDNDQHKNDNNDDDREENDRDHERADSKDRDDDDD